MKVLYHFPGFVLKYDKATGETITHYPDGTQSGCLPGPDDEFHGEKLGITASQHRLLHECGHHLVGLKMPEEGIEACPIVWRDAHGIPQQFPEASTREWRITAISYHALQRVYEPNQFGAMMDFANAGHDPYQMGRDLRDLLYHSSAMGVNVTFEG